MKQNVTESMFVDEFQSWHTYKDNFSIPGLRALYEYLTEYEEGTGEEVELDVVALCCDYSEYDSAWDAMMEYQPHDMPNEGEEGDDLVEIQEKNEAAALEWLQERTTVIPFNGMSYQDGKLRHKSGVIIQKF